MIYSQHSHSSSLHVIKKFFLSTRSVLNLLLSDIMFRYFVLLVFVLHFADILTTKDYIHPVCDSDYEILKPADEPFWKAKKNRTQEEKSVVVKFWRRIRNWKWLIESCTLEKERYDTVTTYEYIVRCPIRNKRYRKKKVPKYFCYALFCKTCSTLQ